MEPFWDTLGPYQSLLSKALADAGKNRVVERIWARDYSVWKDSPDEIINRLGWLTSPEEMVHQVDSLRLMVEEARGAGYKQAVLLGMGGSSLAPEVFFRVFGAQPGYLNLAVIDTTDPVAIYRYSQSLHPGATLFIVASKSGGTIETISALKFFYNWTKEALGTGEAGRHFVVITDPASSLQEIAVKHSFRAVILNDPHIGGRYSALSHFGLFPAALLGLDIDRLLSRAVSQTEREKTLSPGNLNGALLGVILGELVLSGRNKVTLILPPSLASLADWVEQLLAESTGKEGTGILPITGEELSSPSFYDNDRIFVVFRFKGLTPYQEKLRLLNNAGHPLLFLDLDDEYDLGKQFFLWEMATAVACARLGVNPFDQPDVEAAKVLAREVLARRGKDNLTPPEEPLIAAGGISVFGQTKASSPRAALSGFLEGISSPGYVAIQAYVTPDQETHRALNELRIEIGNKIKAAVTLGYGPRYLHSTGQLHKGGPPGGCFIFLTTADPLDLPIPDEMGLPASSLTFGALKLAQAEGDCFALIKAGRPVIRFHLTDNNISAFADLAQDL